MKLKLYGDDPLTLDLNPTLAGYDADTGTLVVIVHAIDGKRGGILSIPLNQIAALRSAIERTPQAERVLGVA